jgi:hypothetical protein
MGLNQPEANISLPEKLQQAIEAGQNKLTTLENETTRLGKLKIQIKTEISNLTGQKKELEEHNTELVNLKTELEDIIGSMNEEKQVINGELLAIRDEIKAERADIAIEREKLITEQNSNKLIKADLDVREKKINVDEKYLEDDKLIFENKRKKLIEALK